MGTSHGFARVQEPRWISLRSSTRAATFERTKRIVLQWRELSPWRTATTAAAILATTVLYAEPALPTTADQEWRIGRSVE